MAVEQIPFTTALERENRAQKRRIRARLIISRLFALAMLTLLVFGGNYWHHNGREMLEELLFFGGLLLATTGFLGRLWCALYIGGRKKRVLVTSGPYSLCRNPLYLFTFIGGTGLAFCTGTFLIPALFITAFALYYPRAIRREEAFLEENFGHAYREYVDEVPRFVPRLRRINEQPITVDACLFRRELLYVAALIVSIGVIEILMQLHEAKLIPTYFLIP